MKRKLLGFLLGLLLTPAAIAQNDMTVTGHIGASGTFTIDTAPNPPFLADVYVAPAGGAAPCGAGLDTNPGTLAAPVLTLDRARVLVQAIATTKDIIVASCAGHYYKSSVAWVSADSGNAGNTITYTNYPGHNVVFSGGTQVTGFVSSTIGTCGALSLPVGAVCYQVTMPVGTPYFERLYYNGQNRFRPSIGATLTNTLGVYGHSTGAISGAGTCGTANAACGMTYTTTDAILNWASLATNPIEVVGFNKWTANIQIVSSINTGTHTIMFTCTGSNCPQMTAGPGPPYASGERYYISNIKENLKLPQQWFYDKATRQLTYIAASGENPNTDIVEVGNIAQPFSATGLQYVTFTSNTTGSLTFQNDNYVLPSTGYASLQLDPNLNSALFTCNPCSNMTFNGVVFRDSTAMLLRALGASTSVFVNGSLFFNAGAYGLQLGVKPANVVCLACTNAKVPNQWQVEGNYFLGGGHWFPSADTLMAGVTNNDNIDYNDISFSYDKGVEICMPATCTVGSAITSSIIMSHNHVHNIGRGVMTDLAGIYIATDLGTGIVVDNNLIHDVNSSALAGDPADFGAHGVYLDGHTGLVTVKNNLIYRVLHNLIHMNEGPQVGGSPNVLSNNILANYSTNHGLQGCVGIQSPHVSFKSYSATSDLCYISTSGRTVTNQGEGPQDNAATTTQQYVSNMYYFTSTPNFVLNNHTSGATINANFATWKGTYNEDTVGIVGLPAAAGFTAPNACNVFPYDPNPGVCDTFTFLNGTGPGFGFVVGGLGIQYSYGPTFPPPIPLPTLLPTFPETDCQNTAGCSF